MQATKLLLTSLSCLFLCLYQTKAQTNGDIRLISDRNDSNFPSITGRVEVYYNNKWGTVCTDAFGRNEANVICNQLGYVGAVLYGNSRALGYRYGSESQSIVMDDVNCYKGAKHILSCNYTEISNCNHFEDVAVECNSTAIWSVNPYPGMIRLIGGRYPSEGLLEVYCNGQWGNVCDDFFETNEATTACRQLGYTHSITGRLVGLIGNISQPIWLDNVRCALDQSCIASCKECPASQEHDCTHSEDVSIRCTYQVTQRQTNAENCQDKMRSDNSISSGAIIAIAITCILMICCCIGIIFVTVASISIARKKRKNTSPKTEVTSIGDEDISAFEKSTQLFSPGSAPKLGPLPDLGPNHISNLGLDHTYEDPEDVVVPSVPPLYDTIPDTSITACTISDVPGCRNTVVYEQRPNSSYLTPGEDRPIYIQAPATTPSTDMPHPFPPSPKTPY